MSTQHHELSSTSETMNLQVAEFESSWQTVSRIACGYILRVICLLIQKLFTLTRSMMYKVNIQNKSPKTLVFGQQSA